MDVTVGGRAARVERRAGTDAKPIVRLSGISDRNAAEALRKTLALKIVPIRGLRQ